MKETKTKMREFASTFRR